MLHRRLLSRCVIAGVTLLSLAPNSGPARGDILIDTAYIPTSTIVTSPASSIVSTSYVMPTSYVVPTAYSSTVVPTYYETYRYRRRRLFERSYYNPSYAVAPTSYILPTSTILPTTYISSSALLPTTYIASSSLMPTTYVSSSSLLPTTYLSSSFVQPTSYLLDTSLVTTSASMCCDTPAPAPGPTRTTTTRPSTSTPAYASPKGNAMTSQPENGPSSERPPSSAVSPGVLPPEPPVPAASGDPSSPPDRTPVSDPRDKVNLPKAGDLGPGPNSSEATPKRDSYRPIYGTDPLGRNILRGVVRSYETRRPEEGIVVVVSSRTGSFVDRTAMTDADGQFKISLPQGDWTVKVTMPSGSVLPVGRDYVTASNGMVTDPSGRIVPELIINR